MKRILLAAIAATVLVISPPALAAGGDVVLRTDNGADGYYYGLGGSGEDRYISEYLEGTYDAAAVICGARVRELQSGGLPPEAQMRGELRLEDPANPGYPDLAPGGLVALADPESMGPCSTNTARIRFFTFGGGAGVPDPGANHSLCAVEPLHVRSSYCGVLLDTSSPPLGFSKYYSGETFGSLPWNHFVELIVLVQRRMDLNIRAHGTARFPGDAGIPVVFTTRPNADRAVTDDLISLTLSIDNGTGAPIARNLEICADQSVLSPSTGLKPISGYFRPVGGGGAIRNPLVIPAGRLVLRLEVPRDAVRSKAAEIAEQRRINLPLRVLIDDPITDADPCLLESRADVDDERTLLGLRRRAGSADDDSAEAFFVVQSPNAPGDALNVRHPAIDLPRTVAFTITGLEVVGGEFGGSGLPGLDAVEIRTEDPVFTRSPDLSSAGLVRSFGTADGVGEAPLPGIGATAVFDVADASVDPTGPFGLAPDLYVVGHFLPGETMPVTAIGADQVPGDTLLGDSSFTTSGIVPVVYDATSNYMLRLLLDGDRATLSGPPPPASVSEHAFLRRAGEVIAIDWRTGEKRSP